jgi:hypothetical protein
MRYNHLKALKGSAATTSTNQPSKQNSKLQRFIRENLETDSEQDDDEDNVDEQKPWLREFRQYLDTREVITEGMSAVTWWGVSCTYALPKLKHESNTNLIIIAQQHSLPYLGISCERLPLNHGFIRFK